MNPSSKSLGSNVLAASAVGLGAMWLARQLRQQARKLDLSGRTVLITGSSRGLGLALAREFARHDARVALCARDKQELEVAARDVRQFGGQIEPFTCDLRDEHQIQKLVTEVEARLGPIDVVVNNAGTIIVGPYEEMTAEDFREAMDVNFWAALHLTLAVAPKMAQRGEGRIVNIASVGGKMPVPHLLPYCASKFAMVGFSSGLRIELAKTGVRVSTIIPGLMRTGSPRNASFKGKHKAEYAWFSLGDSIPGLSMSAARAARRIVQATIFGEAEVTLGLPAKIGSLLYGVAPALQEELSTWANWMLPAANGDKRTRRGRSSESVLTRSPLLHFGHAAERDLNQLGR